MRKMLIENRWHWPKWPAEVQSQSHLGLANTLERSAAGVDVEAEAE